jgi:hypothetical protein
MEEITIRNEFDAVLLVKRVHEEFDEVLTMLEGVIDNATYPKTLKIHKTIMDPEE